MNTEKLEKLKKSLDNKFIPEDVKVKIRKEIEKLEKEIKAEELTKTEVKKETAEIEDKVEKAVEKAEEKAEEKEKPRRSRKPKASSDEPKATETAIKKTAMSVAKSIRKKDEKWSDAMKRATAIMNKEKVEVKKTTKSELERLLARVRRNKSLMSDLSGVKDLGRDAVRKAKPVGKRVSKTGNVYYEYRANKTDRKTYGAYSFADGGEIHAIAEKMTDADYNKNYENLTEKQKNKVQTLIRLGDTPKLALATILYGNFENDTNSDTWKLYTMSNGGGVSVKKPTLKKGDNVFIIGRRWFDRANGNTYHTAEVQVNGEFIGKSRMTYGYDEQYVQTGKEILLDHYNLPKGMKETSPLWQLREYGVTLNKYAIDGLKRDLELGGQVFQDLAGHNGGHFGAGNHGLLDGFSGTHYDGLVGETGAMSSGELFMDGGSVAMANQQVINDASQSYVNYYLGEGASAGIFKDGGVIKNQYEGKSPEQIWKMLNEKQKQHFLIDHFNHFNVADFKGKNLIEISKLNYKDLPVLVRKEFDHHISTGQYAKGGLTTERRYVNKNQDYEVRYAKSRPNRTGYKGKRNFSDGGEFMTDPNFGNFQNNIYAGGGRVESLTKELNRLQRELNSSRLQTYRLGDNSQEAINRKNEREVKLARFNEVLKELRELDAKYAGGGMVGKEISFVRHGEAGKGIIGEVNEDGSFAVATGNSIKLVEPDDVIEIHDAPKRRSFFFAGGGGIEDETPKIYVADLEAYNNGKLSGVWLDLTDYNDADELMDAIQDFLKTSGGEEYAIHDYENLPSSMYSEYMGKSDFEEIYQMIDLAKNNNLPLEVVMEVVSQYDESALDEYYGVYDDEEDFAYQQVEEVGLENFSSPEYYIYISETDRRLIAGEEADSYVEGIKDEDGGRRIIEEANFDLDEYDEADSDRQEEMLDEATEIVREEYYDNWYEGLSDPYYFLVDEIGLYSPEDFFKANFVQVDYEKLARDLEQDYTFVNHDGQVYVFNIR